jgi:hypothetical protein
MNIPPLFSTFTYEQYFYKKRQLSPTYYKTAVTVVLVDAVTAIFPVEAAIISPQKTSSQGIGVPMTALVVLAIVFVVRTLVPELLYTTRGNPICTLFWKLPIIVPVITLPFLKLKNAL